MKIVVLVRTRDEEHRIEKFCRAYAGADRILVADGGSVDNTVQLAKQFPNVEVREFGERVQLNGQHWRNNDSDHTNFLIKWSKEYNPDWVIFDDCDCIPNYILRRFYREVLETTSEDYVMVTRIYFWGKNQHFPHMAKPDKEHSKWEASLWAWRGNQDFWTVNVPPAYTFRIGDKAIADLHFDAKTKDLMPPFALLHYSWDDPERVDKKIQTYRDSGLIPNMLHPLEFAGPLESLEYWMSEEPYTEEI